MDAISLPVMDAGSSPRRALAEMKRAQRSGLVVRSDEEASVLMASQIAGALKKRARHLRDIAGTPVLVRDITPIAQSTPEPYISTDALWEALDLSGRKYGLLCAPTAKTKSAIIFSRDNIRTLVREPTPGTSKKPERPPVRPPAGIVG